VEDGEGKCYCYVTPCCIRYIPNFGGTNCHHFWSRTVSTGVHRFLRISGKKFINVHLLRRFLWFIQFIFTGLLPLRISGWSVRLTNHLHLVPRLTTSRVTDPLPILPSRLVDKRRYFCSLFNLLASEFYI
jgi:hypothetical protein